MSKQGLLSKRFLWIAAASLLTLTLFCLAADAVVSPRSAGAQPRPTLTPSPVPVAPSPTSPPSGPTTSAPSQTGPTTCEAICGRVINLESNMGVPGQTVRFSGTDWSLDTTTDANGEYAYGRMGTEVGVLNVVAPEDSDLRAVTQDIPLAVTPRMPIVVNLGVYRGAWTAPPLAPTVWAEPTWVRPGDRVEFVVQVENQLPTKISGVMVTDILPEALSLIGVTSDRGSTSRTGNYGAAVIGDMEPGDVVTVRMIAEADEDAPTGTIRNKASLIYREHAAAQGVASVSIGWSPPATAAPTDEGDGAEESPEPTVTVAGGDDTPTVLPVTGFAPAALGAGLGLGGTALLAGYLRKRNKKKE